MAEETLSEQLSRYIATLSIERIPTEVVDAAKLHILDSLGCVIAGSRLEPGRMAYNLAVALSPGNAPSMLFGTNLTRLVSRRSAGDGDGGALRRT